MNTYPDNVNYIAIVAEEKIEYIKKRIQYDVNEAGIVNVDEIKDKLNTYTNDLNVEENEEENGIYYWVDEVFIMRYNEEVFPHFIPLGGYEYLDEFGDIDRVKICLEKEFKKKEIKQCDVLIICMDIIDRENPIKIMVI
jgi:hypothetical protein